MHRKFGNDLPSCIETIKIVIAIRSHLIPEVRDNHEFSHIGNADLLATGRDLMESIPRRNSIMNGTSRKTQDPDSFIDNTIRSIVDWTALRLSSYRQLADAAPIPSLLGLLISCQRYLGLGSHDTAQVPSP